MTRFYLLYSTLALAVSAHAVEPVALEDDFLRVLIDPTFPRIISTELKPEGVRLAGQLAPTTSIALNGSPATGQIRFEKTGPAAAEYHLSFPEAAIDVTLEISVGGESVLLRMKDPHERGTEKLMTLAFPGDALVSAGPDATMASARIEGYGNVAETVATVATLDPTAAEQGANYLFVSNGKIAAGLFGNHLQDVQRVGWRVEGEGETKVVSAGRPVWQFREIEDEWLEMPWQRIVVSGDRNGDGTADWQDAALAQRALAPRPFGADRVKDAVADQIAMNFASMAQQPFLRILDGIKRAWLATDGLTQNVTIKGFTAEGHDSANTDYAGNVNSRAGGLRDLRFLEAKAALYNTRIGVHINATEVYPEAHRYDPSILDLDDDGNPQGGWAWLDRSHAIDKRKDILSGSLFKSLGEMRREQPDLAFIYLDVYGDSGWNGWKTAGKINSLGLPLHTEYSTALDPWSVWAHHRKNPGRVTRFLWNADRDLFPHDSLLRGSDHVGFMGWQGERDFQGFLRTTFGRNLPTKYLQHFSLLKWEPGKEAMFEGGVRVVQTGSEVACSRDGRLLMNWQADGSHNRLFVPWDPLSEDKIYVWDEVGGELTRELPPSWENPAEVYLYPLSQRGRGPVVKVPVHDGSIKLNLVVSVPYVIYQNEAPEVSEVAWGEGGFVANCGFDGGNLGRWSPQPPSAEDRIRVENLPTGDGVLVLSGASDEAVGVTQTLEGLKPGARYAASVWVQIEGRRKASLSVKHNGASTAFHHSVSRTRVRNRNTSDSKSGSFFQRLRLDFTQPAGSSTAVLSLLADADPAGQRVEFDDVRVVETGISKEAASHTYFEDFENVDQGWGPFVYASAGPTQTHLSESNPPFTHDTIDGRYSFKTREEPAGMVVRTLPSFLKLKPATRYRIAVETLADSAIYSLCVRGNGGPEAAPWWRADISKGRGKVSAEFVTGPSTEGFLSLEKSAKGGGMCVLDDIAIDELGAATD